MEPRVSFITLAVADVAAAHRFYVERLGWAPEVHVPGEVLMIRVGERLVLSLWSETGFEAEVGAIRRGPGLAPITMAHNCRDRDEVDAVLADAARAGAEVSPGEDRAWGGYSGYFSDLDGYHWEIAWNPHPIGQLVLPEVDA